MQFRYIICVCGLSEINQTKEKETLLTLLEDTQSLQFSLFFYC
jgi:hypothetical protein